MFYFYFFFFNDTATTEIYTLSLHDALPISEALPETMTRPPLMASASTQPSPASPARVAILPSTTRSAGTGVRSGRRGARPARGGRDRLRSRGRVRRAPW